MAVFDNRTGKNVANFGNISKNARLTRTGYAFVNVRSCADGSKLVWTDGYSGIVSVSDSSDWARQTERYELFRVDTALFAPLDTATFYKEEHRKASAQAFYRQIDQLCASDGHIAAIVRYGTPQCPDIARDRYVFASIDRRSGKIWQRAFPAGALAYGIRRTAKGRLLPYAMARTGDGVVVRTYRK